MLIYLYHLCDRLTEVVWWDVFQLHAYVFDFFTVCRLLWVWNWAADNVMLIIICVIEILKHMF